MLKEKTKQGLSVTTTSFKTSKEGKKSKPIKGKEKTIDIETENKLVTTKPWFSKAEILKPENESLEKNPKSVSSVSYGIRRHKKSSIHSSRYIYDTTDDVNANNTLQRSLSTVDSFSGRSMRPRITEDKISK